MEVARAELDWIDSRFPHRLLEAPQPAYSDATLRRAFVVWLHCGHKNVFRDVCNYYHRLANMEDMLPLDRRANSRYQEFHLFYNRPPTSVYLTNHFPKLYSQTHINKNYIKRIEAIRNEQNVFNIEGFSDMKEDTGITKLEIIQVSRMIRKYCKERQMVLRQFLMEFKVYTERCQIKRNMKNVKRYIRNKAIQAEILLEANFPTDFSFLRYESVKEDKRKQTKAVDIDSKPLQNGNNKTYADINSNQIKLISCDAVKTSVKIFKTKEKTHFEIVNNFPVNYSDLVKTVGDNVNDARSVTNQSAVYSKTTDDSAQIKILKRNGNDVNLKIMNSGFPETPFVKIGAMKSRRLS